MAPLFTESMSEREVHAIHSEHEKNIPNDTWRIDQFDKSTSSADHEYNRFGTGSIMFQFKLLILFYHECNIMDQLCNMIFSNLILIESLRIVRRITGDCSNKRQRFFKHCRKFLTNPKVFSEEKLGDFLLVY